MKRRDFLNGLMAGAAALGASGLISPRHVLAKTGAAPHKAARRLAAINRTLDINGKAAPVFGLAQPDGTPGLTLTAGESFDVLLSNELAVPTLVHWHGLTPPWPLDGVPDNPAPLLRPGAARPYRFPLKSRGTYWMHAHTLQEQNLLAAPLIVRTAADAKDDQQEIVLLLHDFSFTPAEELLARLMSHKPDSSGDAHPMAMPENMPEKMQTQGMAMHGMAHGMIMSGTAGAPDVNDIDFDAYLANDRTLADPEIVRIEKNGRVRLRIINAAAATAFTIDTGALPAELLAVDGQDVVPITRTHFPVSMGQRIDLRLRVGTPGAYPILALREGARERTGLVLATAGAPIGKIALLGATKGPLVDLALEHRLRTLTPRASRGADRQFALNLTGDMAAYRWGLSGKEPLDVKRGERIEIAMKNTTMMAHPMHLHGHHFQVVAINGRGFSGALRDTIVVPPMEEVTIAFDADNPGRWPLHCHNLYHMAAGMMTYVNYV